MGCLAPTHRRESQKLRPPSQPIHPSKTPHKIYAQKDKRRDAALHFFKEEFGLSESGLNR